MKWSASVVLMLISSLAWGAPFVVSDPVITGVTQCGVFLDGSPKLTVPVTAVTLPVAGNICKVDVGSVSTGSHTISLTTITVNDPVWGSQESAKSSPLAFTRPLAPVSPSGLSLTP